MSETEGLAGAVCFVGLVLALSVGLPACELVEEVRKLNDRLEVTAANIEQIADAVDYLTLTPEERTQRDAQRAATDKLIQDAVKEALKQQDEEKKWAFGGPSCFGSGEA